nr:HAD hydrolase family protein [uncultured Ligilactobacillus sp.]
MQRKIIAIDIDGTLTDDKKRIMPETKAELIKLSDMGHKIVLCSGRAITGIEPYLKELNLWGKRVNMQLRLMVVEHMIYQRKMSLMQVT